MKLALIFASTLVAAVSATGAAVSTTPGAASSAPTGSTIPEAPPLPGTTPAASSAPAKEAAAAQPAPNTSAAQPALVQPNPAAQVQAAAAQPTQTIAVAQPVSKADKIIPDSVYDPNTECIDQTKLGQGSQGCTKKLPKECVNKLKFQTVSEECIKNLNYSLFDEGDRKEMLEGGVAHLPKTPEFLSAFFTKDLEINEDSAVGLIKDSTIGMYIVKSIKDQDILKKILGHPRVQSSLSPALCAELDEGAEIRALGGSAFAHLKPECIAAIPPAAYAYVTEEQMLNWPAANISSITGAQAAELRNSVTLVISTAQAKVWGTDPSVLPGNYFFNMTSRNDFIHGHACFPAKNWHLLTHIKDEATMNDLKTRCQPIWDAAAGMKSAGYHVAPSVYATVFLVGVLSFLLI